MCAETCKHLFGGEGLALLDKTRTRPLTLHTSRKNRPDQQTFCCRVCGFKTHADINASVNISRRKDDKALQRCKDRKAIKALLLTRHAAWLKQQGREISQKMEHRRRRKGAKDQNQSVSSRKTIASSKYSLSSFVIPLFSTSAPST